MKRRNFLIAIGSLISTTIPALAQVAKSTSQTLVWIKENTLGYKKKATKDKVATGKICLSCSWYADDTKHEYGGECKLKAMQNSMKTAKVMAHAAGNCNMWQKK
jgi:anaerobic selenocysteine-containing dehydrogenase